MNKQPKVLWLSDGPLLTTGYSTISRKIGQYLSAKGYDFNFLSHTHQGQTLMPGVTFEDGEVLNFKLHGAGAMQYCQDIITPKIRELKADVFGILLDTFMLHPWFPNIDLAPAKSLFYFPSDGGYFPIGCENVLRKVDAPVAMSMYAQKQVQELYGINASYIPHAVEPMMYHPLGDEEKLALKKKYGLDGKFVVGVVARNQGRKMLDRTVKAFARAARHMPNAVLFMHTDPFDVASPFNFPDIIQKYGMQNRIVFSGTKWSKGFDYRKMNEIYNIMDVFFLGTSGEGFGIPTIEAMSAGIPVLVTDYTTTEELVVRTRAGEAIKKSDEVLGSWNVERALMDIQDGAERLVRLYLDENLRTYYGHNGRRAVLSDYSWNGVIEQWDALIKKLCQ